MDATKMNSNGGTPIRNPYAKALPRYLQTVGTCYGTRCLALSAGTIANDRTSMNFYNSVEKKYTKGISNKFEDLKIVDICNENIKLILGNHARRCREEWIPKGWGNNGGYEKEDSPRLSEDSIVNYFSPLLQLLKNLDPDHEYLKGEPETQEWWKKMKNDLRQGYKKNKIRGERDSYGPKCSALYIINQPQLIRYSHNDMHALQNIDLHYIVRQLKRNATTGNRNHMRIARLVFSAHAACRSGELKFCRVSNMIFDARFGVLDTTWCEVKTCNSYALPMVNHSNTAAYMVDFYHAVGSAFLLYDEILYRRETDITDFLFAHLHARNDAYVSKVSTKDIRENLPSGIQKEVKDRYSSKSMRKGACTVMCANRYLTKSNMLARSGHSSSGNHFETYVDSVGIGLSLPAAMVLNEYDDPYMMPYSCSFNALPDEDQFFVDEVIGAFFITNINEFKEDGRLYPALIMMGATLIMSYNQMKSMYRTTDLVVGKIEQIFEDIDGLSVDKLATWSKLITEDFAAKNSVSRIIDQLDAAQLISAVNNNTTATVNVMSAISTMADQLEVLRRENKIILRENDNLREIQHLRQLLQNQSLSPNKRSRTEDIDIDIGISVEPHATQDQNGSFAGEFRSPVPLLSRLKMTNEAQEQLKGIFLGDLITTLHRKGMIKKFVRVDGTFDRGSLTLSFVQQQERSKYTCCLELAFFVATTQEIQTLSTSTEDVSSLAKNIELRALAKMNLLENKKGKSKAKGYIVGIGTRVVAYKNKHGGSTAPLRTCINNESINNVTEVRKSKGSRVSKSFFGSWS